MKEKAPSQIELFSQEIREMHEKDQDMRERALANNGIIETEEDSTLDARNTERMKEIISQIGWPTTSKVGLEVSHMAWLLVQHADHDFIFQRYCLGLMKESKEDVDQTDVAYLEDRVLVNEKKLQIYGTQFLDGVPRPIEDPDNVDERRKSAGLESLEEGIRQHREFYKGKRFIKKFYGK